MSFIQGALYVQVYFQLKKYYEQVIESNQRHLTDYDRETLERQTHDVRNFFLLILQELAVLIVWRFIVYLTEEGRSDSQWKDRVYDVMFCLTQISIILMNYGIS